MPSASTVRSQAPPPNIAGQLFGGSRAVGAAAVAEDEQIPLGRSGRSGECGLEPDVLVAAVVRDEVDQHPHAEFVCGGDEPVGLGERAELGEDVAVVGDVVAAVGERRRVPRAHPDGVDAELGEVGQPLDDAGHVAGAVTVGVGERPWVDLVHDGAAPPIGIVGKEHGATLENAGRALRQGTGCAR